MIKYIWKLLIVCLAFTSCKTLSPQQKTEKHFKKILDTPEIKWTAEQKRIFNLVSELTTDGFNLTNNQLIFKYDKESFKDLKLPTYYYDFFKGIEGPINQQLKDNPNIGSIWINFPGLQKPESVKQ